MKASRWHILGFFTVATLWACGGGAGGPGAALDGGGAGGGPVGGGNFAAGPMSLPAPSVVSPDNPVVWASIYCENIPGEEFICLGTDSSVPPPPLTKEIRLKIYAAGAAVARDSYKAEVDAKGAWSFKGIGQAGESVEICPIDDKGNCNQMRILKLRPVGLDSESSRTYGNWGTMKNLVIEPSGNAWHSRRLPKGFSFGTWVASLFISEARAVEAQPYTPISCGDFFSLEVISGDSAPKPQCSLYQSAHGSQVSIRTLTFDDCVQSDIRSIVSLRHPRTGQQVLLVAVKNRVYVVETQPSPRIVWYYSFPGDVVSILEQGGRFVAVAKAATGVPNNLYYVDLWLKPPEGTGCYPALDWLSGLENVTASDLVDGVFTMVAYMNSGQYQVMLGRLVPGSTQFRNPPSPLLPASSTPLEARVLKVEQNWVWVAVMNAAEKKITIVKHFMPDPGIILIGGGEPDPEQKIALEGLTVGTATLTVTRPQLFNVNRTTNELVFVDISETSSKFVALPYAWVNGNIGPITVAAVTDLAGAGPASLRYDSTAGSSGWAYNDSNSQIRRLQTQREAFKLNLPSGIITNETLLQYYQNNPIAIPAAEAEAEE